MAAERRHVQAEVAEDVEGLVEALVGVALVRERADEDAPLLEDLRLELVADAVDVRAVVLREVRLFQRGVELDERGADPRVERFDVLAHRPRSSLTTAPHGTRGLAFGTVIRKRRLVLGMALLVAVGIASAASGSPARTAANSTEYVDERGEDVGSPDITTVVVSNDDSGRLTLGVNTCRATPC